MAKKNYESPKMDEVKVNTESLMQTASGEQATCPLKGTTCPGDDCDEK